MGEDDGAPAALQPHLREGLPQPGELGHGGRNYFSNLLAWVLLALTELVPLVQQVGVQPNLWAEMGEECIEGREGRK